MTNNLLKGKKGLIFGIYPGSGVAIDPGSGVVSGPADEPAQIKEVLDCLQPLNKPFLVRGYVHYIGSGKSANLTPANMEQYVGWFIFRLSQVDRKPKASVNSISLWRW